MAKFSLFVCLFFLCLLSLNTAKTVEVCGYCSGASCGGESICKEYEEDQCIAMYSHCDGSLLGYAKGSMTANRVSLKMYAKSDTTCSSTYTPVSTTCNTCIPLLNAFAKCPVSSVSRTQVCGYCDGQCSGKTTCSEYDLDKCVPLYNQCTGSLISYGYATMKGKDVSITTFGTTDSTCSGNYVNFGTTCDQCIPSLNGFVGCSSATAIIGSIWLVMFFAFVGVYFS